MFSLSFISCFHIGIVTMENISKIKSKQFALRVIKLFKYLSEEKKEYVLSKQILRCGTSIGANLAEAECAISQREFLSKMYISLKECSETRYWLELLYESGYIDKKSFESIYVDCEELMRILSASTKTLREKLSEHN